ncbi:carbohydrate-binding protein [Pseudoalteromonas byunsanensis]|uniref:Chitin-binding type-3 domain-containing protein n=1 Tax=Pseudoalteromonas byunsanensis TaxID=327939 RepID=A0A1S1N3P6_9GAMM|nr:carbohydrate-binding protein [Pseudoalteromonas byunsanensis]OHU94299.1 hypothetical protein BIW53_14545 [Pseudoalteromonas byunsanensis]
MNKINMLFLSVALAAPSTVLASESAKEQLKSNVKQYISAWSEQSDANRFDILKRSVTHNFTYKDPSSSEFTIDSDEKINQWISNFHKDMKQVGILQVKGELVSEIDIHGPQGNEVLRFNWRISGFDGAVVLAEGVDYGTSKDGKLASITGFFGDLTPKCDAKEWSEHTVYQKGHTVTYENSVYEARWWVNESPKQNTAAWQMLYDCVKIAP